MKNLTQRNKIVLAIAGIVIIAIIVVVASAQMSGGQLFGMVTDISILPSSPSVFVGATVQLSTSPAVSCNWSVASPTLAKITSTAKGTTVTVGGVAQGTTTVNAVCGTTTLSTTLKVYAMVSSPTPTVTNTRTPTSTATPTLTRTPTNTPTPTRTMTPIPLVITPSDDVIWFGQTKTFSTNANDSTCTWTTSDSQRLPIQGSNVGASVTVKGNWLNSDWGSNIYATLSVNCSGRTASRRLNIVSN